MWSVTVTEFFDNLPILHLYILSTYSQNKFSEFPLNTNNKIWSSKMLLSLHLTAYIRTIKKHFPTWWDESIMSWGRKVVLAPIPQHMQWNGLACSQSYPVYRPCPLCRQTSTAWLTHNLSWLSQAVWRWPFIWKSHNLVKWITGLEQRCTIDCTILYCTVLYITVLQCTVCTVLQCAMWCHNKEEDAVSLRFHNTELETYLLTRKLGNYNHSSQVNVLTRLITILCYQ